MRARVARRAWVAPVVLPTLLVVALVAARHPRTVYTSDSVAQQSILRTWLDVGHHVTYVPPDTWLLKLPVYLVLENLPLSPQQRILAAVVSLNAICFVLLGVGAYLLAPAARWYQVTVPLLWLAALGGGIAGNRMLPNYRNLELGLCFLLLGLAARFLGRPGGTVPSAGQGANRSAGARAAITVAVVLGLAVFWLDDPYFALLVAAPLGVASLGWWALHRWWWQRPGDVASRHLWLGATVLGSVVLHPVLAAAAGAVGVRIGDSGRMLAPSLAAGLDHVRLLAPGAGVQLGVDRWDGDPLRTATQVLLLATLAGLLAASLLLGRHGWRTRRLLPFFVGLHWPLVVAAYLVSWYAQDIRTSRYLVLIVYDVAIAAAMLAPRMRTERVLAGRALAAVPPLLALTAVLGAAGQLRAAVDADRRPSPLLEQQAQLVRAVQRAGPVKGYAPFWSANISSYLAGGGRTAVELVCSDHRLATRQWLSDTARLDRPAGSTFLVWVPDALTLRGCPAGTRDAQLGAPSSVLPAGGGSQVLVYPYDIADRLGSVTPP